jgi:2-oxoglutarate dehydrogenase E1 component
MNGDSFLPFGPNAGYLAELYQLYLSDPSVVDPVWAEFFESLDSNGVAALTTGHINGGTNGHAHAAAHGAGAEVVGSSSALAEKIVQAFRTYGHAAAQLSPLTAGGLRSESPRELTLPYYGEDRGAEKISLSSFKFAGASYSSCATLMAALGKVYSGSIGFEFMHLTKAEERAWLQERIEKRFAQSAFSDDQRREIFDGLMKADIFESELHRKYVGAKRFSLEGNDTLIPLLSVLARDAAASGVKGIIAGMAHRGRLNVLVNTLGKPLSSIFSEFEDKTVATIAGAGDVKYHLGFVTQRAANGTDIHMEIVPNPSHLEFVNPVVEGISRALQDQLPDRNRGSYLPLVMHGDAAFAGQGVVFETINYAGLAGYTTGGTFHIVINNQIGFTTTPDEARSTRYCTDLAKGIDCPVFHVNAEDPEAACWVTRLALEYRMTFGKDVFVDLIGHRKHGHNEGDDPSFTQPATYAEVKSKKPIWQQYSEKLMNEGMLSSEEVSGAVESYKKAFADAQAEAGQGVGSDACAVHGKLYKAPGDTGVSAKTLKSVAKALLAFSDDFKPHPKLLKIIEKRAETVETGEGIEWGVAEALAFGSLVLEGRSIRLSGQDCMRGTFSHRHLVLDDFEGRGQCSPIAAMLAREGIDASFEIFNSSLSEQAVLGFEFGYSAANPDCLTMWEAQFGDFSNGAQIIIDQFITSSEAKWGQRSGVVMMLPHGYEGQGPEHSSARLERYLQMCAENNMSVCYPSSAAQHFHLMRRQGVSEIKRPLIIMTPKSLLRLPAAMSSLAEMTKGGFKPVIETDLAGKKACRDLVFLTGKIYYDVHAALQEAGKASARLIRVEELYPFPEAEVSKIVKESGAKNVFWVQEEPQNMGAWSYIEPLLRKATGATPVYVGRPASAGTSTGSGKHHALEQKAITAEIVRHLSA